MAGRVAGGGAEDFSVRFDTPEFDETEFQVEMARALGTDHSAVICRSSDIAEAFPDVIRHTEQPILRTAPAPLHLLSDLVREEGFKVVLTGEGADEVFGGYDIFKEAKLRRFCAVEPGSLRRPLLFRKLYPYLPKLQAQSAAYLKAFFATDLDAIGDPLFSHLPRFRSTAGAKLFFSSELKQELAGYDAIDELRSTLPDEFHALASSVAGAVPGNRAPAAGLHPVLPGRSGCHGSCRGGPLPLPRPPRRGDGGKDPAVAEASRV